MSIEIRSDPRVADAALAVRSKIPRVPNVGVVLGSGLGGFVDTLTHAVRVPYAELPHFRPPSVAGHSGFVCFGESLGVPVLCLQGRIHLYEGHDVGDVVLGCRVLAELGCKVVLLTNAAGGIRADLSPGALMLILDHLNLTGRNPLAGIGHAFVDLSRAYDEAVAEAARRAAADTGVALAEGVYAGLLGPSYETPAEIRMLRTLGADAVGMSTVMEVIALRHAGARVGAVSCITNVAAGLAPGTLDHQDVQATAHASRKVFERLLAAWIARCAELVQ